MICTAWAPKAAWSRSAGADQSILQIPSVQELLDNFTKALDATQSFIESYEEVCDYSNRMPGQSKAVGGKRFARGQLRSDGHRIYLRNYYWGDFTSKLRDLPESTPRYRLRIEADGKLYSHTTAVNTPRVKGTADFQPSHYEKGVMNRGSCSGIHGFLGSEERLDAVLRGANRVSVRSTTETVRGFACYVIDADTEYGQYTVWLDPAHGYNAAKVTRKAVGGQKEQEDVMPKGDRSTGSVVITRFEQMEGVWVPVEAEDEIAYTSGEFFRSQRDHFKRTKITLNPDHDKLGSFDNPLENPANDPELRNGTRVRITVPGFVRVKGSWQDGKVVDESGKTFDLKALAAEYAKPVSLVGKALPSLDEFNVGLNPALIRNRMLLVCFWDMNQRPSRTCIQTLNRMAQALLGRGVYIAFIHAESVTEQTLLEWLKENQIHPPVGVSRAGVSSLRRTWGVKSLPWLILTDAEHVVTAEGFRLNELDEKLGK